jgi:hypothetical protein
VPPARALHGYRVAALVRVGAVASTCCSDAYVDAVGKQWCLTELQPLPPGVVEALRQAFERAAVGERARVSGLSGAVRR